ncbi:hypothetical protein VNI00_010101 [Paramarasmius palmivorus]|uniref:F-box domain-containing protein n=1 Tax=Paramarasmius palmivorus TaxID=297713 RepID=A0AAW0CLM3_9AGAR
MEPLTPERGKLPPELISHILKFLSQDTPDTLQNCALVSWTWCNSARPLIFRSISINTGALPCQTWVSRFRSAPRIASLVIHLSLSGVYHHFPGSHSEPKWSIADAQNLAKELAHIQALTITNDTLDEDGPYHVFLRHLHGLQKLTLFYIELESPEHLFSLMACAKTARNLSELSMLYVGSHQGPAFALFQLLPIPSYMFGFGDAPIIQYHGPPLWSLRRLTISSTEIRKDVLSMLTSSMFDYSCFVSLTLESAIEPLFRDHGADPMVRDLFETLIAVTGPAMRCLTLGVSNGGERSGNDNLHLSYIISASLLKHLKPLVRLVLRSGGLSGGLLPASALAVASRLFPTLQGHELHLEEIAIVIDVGRFDEPCEMILNHLRTLQGWQIFDDRLESTVKMLPNFRRLLFVISVGNGKPLDNEISAIIRNALPKANARKSLEVHVEVPVSHSCLLFPLVVEQHLQGPGVRTVIKGLSQYESG